MKQKTEEKGGDNNQKDCKIEEEVKSKKRKKERKTFESM